MAKAKEKSAEKPKEKAKFKEDLLVPFGHKKGKNVEAFLSNFGYDKTKHNPSDFCLAHWGFKI